MSGDPATRRWRLRGYGKGDDGKDQLLHDSVCTGDAALNEALRHLESDPAITRIPVQSI